MCIAVPRLLDVSPSSIAEMWLRTGVGGWEGLRPKPPRNCPNAKDHPAWPAQSGEDLRRGVVHISLSAARPPPQPLVVSSHFSQQLPLTAGALSFLQLGRLSCPLLPFQGCPAHWPHPHWSLHVVFFHRWLLGSRDFVFGFQYPQHLAQGPVVQVRAQYTHWLKLRFLSCAVH